MTKSPDGIYVQFPDYRVQIPGGKKLPLGHGMVIAVDENTGRTRGSEYGRYDKENKGLARRVRVPDLRTNEDLDAYAQRLYNSYKKKHPQLGNSVKIHYIKDADENKMIQLMKSAESGNGFYTNKNYNLINHNCGTYGIDLLKKAGAKFRSLGFGTPKMVAPLWRPTGEYK